MRVSKQETIDEYLELRGRELSPAVSFRPFFCLMSCDPAENVNTGFDAYREYFPIET